MISISNVIFYVLIFLSVYVQVFFLITFLENRKKIVVRNGKSKLTRYPAVTIVVPCWNEERTAYKTIRSVLNLNYPKDKLKIFLIDDGSTDGTWNVIRKFEKPARPPDLSGAGGYSNIKIFRQKNGGKYTALNLGLKHLETDFFGGLDADSLIDSESLVRLMSCFEQNPDIMAVAPSVLVHNPISFIQHAQNAEYHMGVYLKKMLAFLGAINVTPGPLTIFRRKVFDDLGSYRHGHNTEDMEIAYRMQKNHYKIEHCNDAYVYTNTPRSGKKLYKQRLRWIYGFINNTIDYRHVLFRKKYGNFATFTLPMGLISILAVSYLFGRIVYNLGNFVHTKISVLNTVGLHSAVQIQAFDPFFFKTPSFLFLIILLYSSMIFAIIFGQKMAGGKWKLSMDIVYFFPVFLTIAPLWLLKAMYNTLLQRKPAWR